MDTHHEARGLARVVPMVGWLRTYDRSWLTGDLVAGLTVWALVVPESMAYAGVAGVPVQYGLYAVILAVVGYAVFGSSPRLFVGPSSTVAALSAVVVGSVVSGGGDDFVALSAALAVLVGVLYVLAGLLRLGFVANFFAKPVLDGFIAGLGLYIAVGQLPKLVGIESPDGNTVLKAVRTVAEIGDWSVLAAVVGVAALVLLFGLERFAPRLPGALLVAAAGIAVTAVFGLADVDGGGGLAIVGEVPTGFSPVSWDGVTLDAVVAMVPGALGILVVGFAQSVAIAKAYATKYHDPTDPSQEMIGYGAANVGAGLLGGFTVTGSLSKSAAAESAGGRTPVVSLTVGIATLATVLFLAGVFEQLPEPVLAAIVIVAVWGMIDFAPVVRLRRAGTVDFWLALAAFAGVVLVGILPGIVVGVVLSLMLFQHRVDRPHAAVLGRRPDGQTWGDLAEHDDYRPEAGVFVYRWDAPLIFANADHFGHDLAMRLHDRDESTRAVVVDCETCFDIDTTGSATLEELQATLADDGIALHLAHLHGEVRDALVRDGTLAMIGPDHVHDTVRGAVDAALAGQATDRHGDQRSTTGDPE
ncbi:SulP family inorganic anion transporter [Salsipaludibacter albus]|uniref:SulP family inorganic anion transporter n=1 Tax=Salsipaludibacter albus TaxID=2849650 RepID=UPI001EE3ACF2